MPHPYSVRRRELTESDGRQVPLKCGLVRFSSGTGEEGVELDLAVAVDTVTAVEGVVLRLCVGADLLEQLEGKFQERRGGSGGVRHGVDGGGRGFVDEEG